MVADPHPLCAPTPVSFEKLFLGNEEDDEESAGLADLLVLLKKRWLDGFMSRNLVAYLEPDDEPPSDQAREMLALVERCADKPLRPISSTTVSWTLKKLSDAPVTTGEGMALVLRRTHDRKNGDTFQVAAIQV